MNLAEAARLYQCALEEQRVIRDRADDGYDPDMPQALENINDAVADARHDLVMAHYNWAWSAA